ncbi:hypothetical protein E2C01_066418 [Portunus trituberculatus]|uniref:Uncharacterized protein n=1 Tax=Portunus trituberculatus TaxID=210409 RepID=A0A5B7HUM1_PORTR|nr:hypothetical protein [Portunus trituberculatus]
MESIHQQGTELCLIQVQQQLKSLGVPAHEVINTFKMFILPKLTDVPPTWSPHPTIIQLSYIKRIQKKVIKIILGTTLTDHYIASLW